jgi:hypothetical protein
LNYRCIDLPSELPMSLYRRFLWRPWRRDWLWERHLFIRHSFSQEIAAKNGPFYSYIKTNSPCFTSVFFVSTLGLRIFLADWAPPIMSCCALLVVSFPMLILCLARLSHRVFTVSVVVVASYCALHVVSELVDA